uniref:Uncharacterized protein n=1 Tax=Dunaliella tertiolecta TaxID=3047 RepID=A0A7S3QPK3_DUNTE
MCRTAPVPNPSSCSSSPSPPKCLASASWIASFLAATYQQLPTADPHFCAMVGHSLARLGIRPSPHWMERYLCVCTQCCLPTAKPVELMCIARTLSVWRVEPGPSWAAAFMARFATILPQATPKQAANTVLALAHLRWPPPPPLLVKLQQQWEQQQAEQVGLADIQQLLRAAPLLPGLDVSWLERLLAHHVIVHHCSAGAPEAPRAVEDSGWSEQQQMAVVS